MMKAYLINDAGISTVKAFVMKENQYSSRALLKNGFVKSGNPAFGKNWGGQETVELEEYTFQKGEKNDS